MDPTRTHRHWSTIAFLFMAFAGLGMFELGKADREHKYSRRGGLMFVLYMTVFFIGWVGFTHQDAFREWWYRAV